MRTNENGTPIWKGQNTNFIYKNSYFSEKSWDLTQIQLEFNILMISFKLSPSAMSASLALLNRIKSLENQKKRTNQITSTAIKAAAAAASSAAISSTQLYGNAPAASSYRLTSSPPKHSQNGLIVYEQQNVNDVSNRSVSPMQSPAQNRRSGKIERFLTFIHLIISESYFKA